MDKKAKIEKAMSATKEAMRLLEEITLEYFKDEDNSVFIEEVMSLEECPTCQDDGGPYD
jgi:hypothetical protein